MNNIRRLTIAGRILWAAGTDFWLAGMFLVTWARPDTFGARTVHHLTFVMLLEFLAVHATGFLGAVGSRDDSRRQRFLLFGGLLLFYALFAASFSALYGGWWPLAAFMVLMASKFPMVVLRPPDFTGQTVIIANWAVMTALYLSGVFMTAILFVPAWGVTPEVIAAQGFDIGGIWPEEPYRVLAFGVFYFTGLGIQGAVNEILGVAIAKKRPELRQSM